MDYSYDQQPAAFITPATDPSGNLQFFGTTSQGGFDVKDTVSFISGGVTLFADRFFVDINGLTTDEGNDSSDQAIVTSFESIDASGFPVATFTSFNIDQEVEFDRSEYSISAGFAVNENFILFAGYRRAEADFDFDRSGMFEIDLLSNDGSFVGFLGNFTDNQTYDMDQDGPFVGATYAWTLGENSFRGALTANVAVAFLDQEVDVEVKNSQFTDIEFRDFNTGDVIPLPTLQQDTPANSNIRGDTVGITFGLGWKGFTDIDGLTYSLGLSGYSYQFEADGDAADTEETVITYKLGIAYAF